MKKATKILALLLTAVLVFACIPGCDSRPVLRVFNWGDYVGEGIIQRFEEEYGYRVIYDTFEQNEDMYVKITTGGENYDIVIPSDYMISRMIEEDLLQKIDKTKIPNLANLSEEFKNTDYDINGEYSVPYLWGTIGIAYDTTKVTAEEASSWDLLWNEKYKGQIIMLDSTRDIMGIALKRLGYSMNSIDKNELEAARQSLMDQSSLVKAYRGDQIKDNLASGEAPIGLLYSGDFGTLYENNDSYAYSLPEEGFNLWIDAMVIMKNAQNVQGAHDFINFMCDNEIAAINQEAIYYCSPIKAVSDNYPEDVKDMLFLNPPEELLENGETFVHLPADIVSLYDEIYTSVLVAK